MLKAAREKYIVPYNKPIIRTADVSIESLEVIRVYNDVFQNFPTHRLWAENLYI